MLLALAIAAPAVTPVAVTSTVEWSPTGHRFEVSGTWTIANANDAPLSSAQFDLMHDVTLTVSSSVGGVRAEEDHVSFEPALAREQRFTFAFHLEGEATDGARRFVTADEVFLDGGAGPTAPRFDGPARVNVCVNAPPGWFFAIPGDPTSARCGTLWGTQPTIVAARREAHVYREGRYTVAVAPEHRDAARPLLEEAKTIVTDLEERFGPRATEALSIVELSIDSAYSMNGVIVLHPGVATSIAEDGREAPFLAHEIAHQWFGSRTNGPPAYREGLATLMALEHARRRGEGDTYVRALIDRERGARPGLTIREIDPSARWRDYDAVAYARAALAFDRLQSAIGRDRFDALVRRYLDRYRGRSGTLDDLFDPLEIIAPDFDRARFVTEKIDADWDPAADAPRPERVVLGVGAFAPLALLAWAFVAWFRRGKMAFAEALLALVAIYAVHVNGWIDARHAAVGLAVVVAPNLASRRWPRVAVLGGLGWVAVAAVVFLLP